MPAVDIDPARPALTRLTAIAQHGTSQARRVANLLLAWADATAYGGFDPMDLAQVDAGVARDILAILALIAQAKVTPAELGFGEILTQLAAQWRPQPHRAPHPAGHQAAAPGL